MKFDKLQIYPELNAIEFVRNKRKPCKTILISHGSAGIGTSEFSITEVLLELECSVIILDHFTSRGIVSQYWHKYETTPSIPDRVVDICGLSKEKDISGMIGISAGGTAVLMASSKVLKPSIAIYPSTYPLTRSMVNAYNSTMICGSFDDWTTPDHARELARRSSIDLIEVPGYHGFLKQDDRYLEDTISLRNSKNFDIVEDDHIPDQSEFSKGVNVRYSEEASNITFDSIKRIVSSWI